MPGHRLLGYLQDHDQVGNRAVGERSSALMSRDRLAIGAALVLTAPFTPMLWMGEEWGATTPWQYFTDHQDADLADAVRTGRRKEFAAFGWDPEEVPDPQDEGTFARSRLDWSELDADDAARTLDWHRKLVALRRDLPDLFSGDLARVEVSYDEDAAWLVVRRGETAVVVNLDAEEQRVPVAHPVRAVLLSSKEGFTFDPAGVTLAGDSVVVAVLTDEA
jgi:maltooligosyltrehalose trehalohydrolase